MSCLTGLFLVLCPLSGGQSASVLGDWVGAIRMPSETVTIFLHVKEVDGALQARLEIPNVRDIEFDRVAFEAPRLHLARSLEPIVELEALLEERDLRGTCALGGGLAGEYRLVRVATGGADQDYERAASLGFLGPDGMVFVARGHALLHEDDRAFAWLSRAHAGGVSVLALFTDPEFDRLRSDPRWREICRDSTTDHPELSSLTRRVRRESVRSPLRDGVELAGDLLLPDEPARFPTILVRTPYSQGSEVAAYAHLAPRGYALLVQSVRGRAESGGSFVPWMNERKDGFDTIAWIAGQPWSDGKVGMIGGSYLGQVQWAAAAEAPPALRCIVPIVAGTDHFFDVPYDHGILKQGLVYWAFSMDQRSSRPFPAGPGESALKTLPLSKLDDALFGQDVAIWNRWLDCDSPQSWQGANFLGDAGRIDLPVLHVSGWWDGELGATMRNHATLRAAGHEDQWLVLGPWPHNVNRSTRFADVDYGASAILDLPSLYVRWFDHWLKGEPVGLESVPRVQVFVTGADEWRALDRWPDLSGGELELYLDSGPALQGMAGRGRLVSQPGSGEAPDEFTYDPDQVRSRGRMDLERSTRLALDPSWKDGLLYESDPLEDPVEIGGPGLLELHFSTSARDTDLFALLLDVDLDDVARAFTGPGRMRLRYLQGYERPVLLEPGRVQRVAIELLPCAHRFEAGHRIALFLCSEWFPDLERNLNTGERIRDGTRMEVARQRVFHDSTRPSLLRLPLLPAKPPPPK